MSLSVAETNTFHEVMSQPQAWRLTASLAEQSVGMPHPGERVAAVGCGTSYFIAQSYASSREAADQGETDAFIGSEFPVSRNYDRVVLISRSGTTTELLECARNLRDCPHPPKITVITCAPGSALLDFADDQIIMEFADERSVVQTRAATCALVFLRASLGFDVTRLPSAAQQVLDSSLDPEIVAAQQWTFIGAGPAFGLANEAALKLRESTQSWCESYQSMEYRHGPISIAEHGRVVWSFGPTPSGLAEQLRATDAVLIAHERDPLLDLVAVHRLALAVAEVRGLNPDMPRALTRSVILR